MTANQLPMDLLVDDPPERIVSLTPGNTEILFALGAGKRLVGVSHYCDYPPEAQALPKVARFIDTDEAAILALQPDLVLTSSHLQKAIVERLIERDLTVLALNPTDLTGVFRDMILLGQLVNVREQAQRLVVELHARVVAVVAAGLALPYHPRVYLEEWGKPLISAGWWLADFITLAGGAAALPMVESRPHSREQIIEPETMATADPEVILVSWPGIRNDVPRQRTCNRPEWQQVSAVRHGRVFLVDDRLLHRPGPRLVDGLEAIARIVAEFAYVLATEGDHVR